MLGLKLIHVSKRGLFTSVTMIFPYHVADGEVDAVEIIILQDLHRMGSSIIVAKTNEEVFIAFCHGLWNGKVWFIISYSIGTIVHVIQDFVVFCSG